MFTSSILKNNFNLLRILAAVQVLIVHSFNHFEIKSVLIDALKIFPGVPMFFFISGYLIGGTYIRNLKKGNRIFFMNRVLRLYPALIVCFIISLLLVYFSGYFSEIKIKISSFIIWSFSQITFFQFYNAGFMRGYGDGVLNGALWTISVEIQFYLLTPIIYYFFLKRKSLLIFFFVVSIIVNVYLKYFLNWELTFMKLLTVSFIPWVYMFLLGYLCSIYKNELIERIKKINILLVLLIYIVSMNFIGSYQYNAQNGINPISVLILSVLIIKFSQMKIYLPKIISNFIDRNDLSYGIYIYHMPIINFLLYIEILNSFTNVLLTIFSSFAFALLSWKFIEKNMLKLKK
ncbi:acyltransferase family protein [Winogradskyella sp.]|uniref:acyltransferase family protein n=1 Tax=Winogradskyella sp. TaxID=1883156 RepID=UPI003AB90F06